MDPDIGIRVMHESAQVVAYRRKTLARQVNEARTL
jgi:hypothetical protein